jgi:hypothetical protein|tara:strand:- start:21 stop:200 length:180 start_codon:yes stop_codon:yes gene_type:complete
MIIEKYGVKKTWNNKYETYAYVNCGNYAMPITWLREVFKTKKKAEEWLENKLKNYKRTR